ncbi:hypothetical protein [Acaryochloris sp. IP29b_bin.137]|uniref:hypothetical protein n=1 Tax=Acaryochloris sp. IP29b_bin.137 TaxID=2969217 RepID=UPI002619C558|nr:hypothetical protein [Acaryochloris sp. IP29b_bin.137]
MRYIALGLLAFLALIVLASYGVVSWADIATIQFVDWIMGLAIFGWLVTITTVPWNVHFQAREVVAEINLSLEKGIQVDSEQRQYAVMVGRRSLWVALALHGTSAAGLFGLAWWHISAIGYFGSLAALLLTVLRPSIRAYYFLAKRLSMIQRQCKYPREDMLELRGRVAMQEKLTESLIQRLNLEDPTSWISGQQRQWASVRQDLNRVMTALETLTVNNQVEHDQIVKDAENAISQLSEDAQFLNQVRELLRFVKAA